jgi:hypothetical protein
VGVTVDDTSDRRRQAEGVSLVGHWFHPSTDAVSDDREGWTVPVSDLAVLSSTEVIRK